MKLSDKGKFRIDYDDGSGPAGHLIIDSWGKICFEHKYPVDKEDMISVIKIIEKLEKEFIKK